jgi:hypothetical protein
MHQAAWSGQMRMNGIFFGPVILTSHTAFYLNQNFFYETKTTAAPGTIYSFM